jgi:hypothetical protein
MSEAAPGAVKISVVLDSSGRVVGAFKPTEYRPAKPGDEPVVSVGVVAAPGQTVIDVEVPPDVANLDAPELLARLGEQGPVKAVVSNIPTAGQGGLGPSQTAQVEAVVSNIPTAGQRG